MLSAIFEVNPIPPVDIMEFTKGTEQELPEGMMDDLENAQLEARMKYAKVLMERFDAPRTRAWARRYYQAAEDVVVAATDELIDEETAVALHNNVLELDNKLKFRPQLRYAPSESMQLLIKHTKSLWAWMLWARYKDYLDRSRFPGASSLLDLTSVLCHDDDFKAFWDEIRLKVEAEEQSRSPGSEPPRRSMICALEIASDILGFSTRYMLRLIKAFTQDQQAFDSDLETMVAMGDYGRLAMTLYDDILGLNALDPERNDDMWVDLGITVRHIFQEWYRVKPGPSYSLGRRIATVKL